jgi:diguanylate cyclase (GGDEF)-like protein/PAS domain S-box-containing protein
MGMGEPWMASDEGADLNTQGEGLGSSEEQYRLLFESNPLPMWVFDQGSLRFLAVNEAAVRKYGFTEEEFLAMTIAEIRPAEEVAALMEDLRKRQAGLQEPGIWKHRKKNGEPIEVEIVCHRLKFHGIDAMLVCSHEITERIRAAENLHDSENRYHVLFEQSADANFLVSEDVVLDWNSAAVQMFGYLPGEPLPPPVEMSPPTQADGTPSSIAGKQRIMSAFQKGRERFEWLHQRRDGIVFQAEVSLTALTLRGQSFLLSTVRDISERKKAEEALLFKNALLEGQTETTIDGILAIDENDHIVLANKQFGLQFGVPDEVLSKRDDRILRRYVVEHIENPGAFLERIAYLNSRRDKKSRDELRLKSGKIFDRYSAPLVDSNGRYRGRIWYHRDITESKAAEGRIEYLAYYDPLTGLPNRSLLQDRLENALADARRRQEKLALLFMDLDRFKIYNDSLGHNFGDLLLKDVAQRLRACTREQDMVARIGGDEFLIVLTGVKAIADVAVAAERMMTAMNAGFMVQGRPASIGCSLGISIFPEHGVDSETLIKNADAAMYCVKENGRSSFRFFTEEMHAQAVERLTLENDLRRALDRSELNVVYQPQLDVARGRITGFEALLRWGPYADGLVPPEKFIPVAETSSLILPIGEWVLRTACAQARRWQLDGLLEGSVAVNVSAVQFRQAGFSDVIRAVLHDTGLPAHHLELELTEGSLMPNAAATLSILNELREMGVNLAIDDFGTGYSSLSYLKYLPMRKLKIDRSLIQDLAADPGDAAIAVAIISMAKSLHLKVVAEGVEIEEQMSFLRQHGCDEIQGYYFSQPLSADAASDLLRRRNPNKAASRALPGEGPLIDVRTESWA